MPYHFTFPLEYSGSYYALGVVFPIVALVLLALRLVARRKQIRAAPRPSGPGTKGYGMDDMFAVLSWLEVLIIGVIVCYATSRGYLGRQLSPASTYQDPVNPSIVRVANGSSYFEPVQQQIRMDYILNINFALALGCIKLCILFFYARIFVTRRTSVFAILLYALITFVVLWAIALTIGNVMICGGGGTESISYISMELMIPNLECGTASAVTVRIVSVVSDVVLDVLVLLLPIPPIWSLNLHLAAKLSTIGIFLLGVISIFASIARLVSQIELIKLDTVTPEQSVLTYGIPLYWGVVEVGAAFIAAQLPSLSILFRGTREKRWYQRLVQSSPFSSATSSRTDRKEAAGLMAQPGGLDSSSEARKVSSSSDHSRVSRRDSIDRAMEMHLPRETLRETTIV